MPGNQLKIDLDQIRFELGGCTYAAFCIAFVGKVQFLPIKIIRLLDMCLAYAVYKRRGFEDLRYHREKIEQDEEDKYRNMLETMGQTGQMPRNSVFEPYYTAATKND